MLSVSTRCVVAAQCCVTQLHDVVYIFNLFSELMAFNAATHDRLPTAINFGPGFLRSVVACDRTRQLYALLADGLLARISEDGAMVQYPFDSALVHALVPSTLSVTSARLLVTSQSTKQLMQFDADGNQRRLIRLQDDLEPWHAMESPTGTFIVSHYSEKLRQWKVVEVNNVGEVLHQFSGSRLPRLSFTPHVAVDSRGRIFVVDPSNYRILLLDARLVLRRVIIDEHQLNYEKPSHLCYVERSGQLLVGLAGRVAVFNMLVIR